MGNGSDYHIFLSDVCELFHDWLKEIRIEIIE
jgi:hypothetical protein